MLCLPPGPVVGFFELGDPGALVEPWTVPHKYEYDADTEQIEYLCNENERDHQHRVGKASDQKGVDVDKAILSNYVGACEFSPPHRPDLTRISHTESPRRARAG